MIQPARDQMDGSTVRVYFINGESRLLLPDSLHNRPTDNRDVRLKAIDEIPGGLRLEWSDGGIETIIGISYSRVQMRKEQPENVHGQINDTGLGSTAVPPDRGRSKAKRRRS